MKLRIEGKETKNYDNHNNERYVDFNIISKDSLTFEEILTKIKLSKNKKIKRKFKIKRYKKEKTKILKISSKIIVSKTKTSAEKELEEDRHIYNSYIENNDTKIVFNSEEFKEWKEQNNNRFIPPLNAPWQVRKVFRCMNESLPKFEKERFNNIKFELWIYINRTILVQEKMLDIIYGKKDHKDYNNFVMGNLIKILNNLDSIEGYIQLLEYIKEKKESIYKSDKNYLVEIDLSILSSMENLLRNYAIENYLDEELRRLLKKPICSLKKYKINNFFK